MSSRKIPRATLAFSALLLLSLVVQRPAYSKANPPCPPGCQCLTGPDAEAQFGTGSFKACSDTVCGWGWVGDLWTAKYCFRQLSTTECNDTDGGMEPAVKGATPNCVDQCSEFSHPPVVLKECYAEVVDGQCVVQIGYYDCKAACDDGRCLPPTCDDWIQNQSEGGVDCEGPCDQSCVCPPGYKCASTQSAIEQFGENAFIKFSDDVCATSGPQRTESYCYKKLESYECVDTDGGLHVDVKGSTPGCEDECVSSRKLEECLVISSIDGCQSYSILHTCDGLCENGACKPPSCDDGIQNQDEVAVDCGKTSIYSHCDSCCGSGIKDYDEEGVDCGGSQCLPCGWVGVRGRILYEDTSSKGGLFKPVRHGNLRLRLCPDHPCFLATAEALWVTDSQGYFNFMVPRQGFESAFIRLGHVDNDDPYSFNYAVRIARDWDDCDETVWWHTSSRELPQAGVLNFGDLRIGKSSNLEFSGHWQEETDAFTCGGGDDEHGGISGGSGYFNIADAILYARQYADARRSDDDAISSVDVQWPDDTETSHYSSGWEEISLEDEDGFSDGTIIHEYAHYLQDAIGTNDDYWGSSDHTFCTFGKDEEFAWKEGFADYLGTVVPHRYEALSKPARGYSRIERPYCFENSSLNNCCDWPGKESEATVAAVLWDLADDPLTFSGSVGETFDTLADRETLTFKIFDDELDNGDSIAADAPDLCEFIEEGVNCRVSDAVKQSFWNSWKHYNVICSTVCDD